MKTAAWLVVMTAGTVAAPVVASADSRVGIGIAGSSSPRGYRDAYAYGFERGRRDGAEEGRDDGRRRHEFEYWREGRYRKGTSGYKGWMGPKWDYANGYRRGYESAYRRAFAAARGYRGYYGDEPYGYDRRYDDRYRDWDR
jgi:hypothetical protein